jgi:hypothetical protein
MENVTLVHLIDLMHNNFCADRNLDRHWLFSSFFWFEISYRRVRALTRAIEFSNPLSQGLDRSYVTSYPAHPAADSFP